MPSAETNWVHVAGVFSGTNMTAYANGEKLFDAPIAAVKDTDNKLVFGSKDRAEVKGHLTGLMDEFRLRDAISTADWIKAEYDQSKTTFLETQEIKPSRQGRQAIRFAAPPKCTAATPRVVAHHMTTCPICVREGGGRKRACGRRASQRDDPARLTKPASATERKRSPNIVAAQAAVKSPHMPTHP